MKSLSLALLSAVILFTAFSASYSCSKDNGTGGTKYDTVYVTKHDTLSSPTRLQILTQKTWEVDQLIHVISGTYSTYLRGGANTTGLNYDAMRFTFNSNGTGTDIDVSGNSYPLTWQFTDSTQRTIQLTTNATTYKWNMVELKDNYLHATAAPLTVGSNSNNMESFRLIQVVTQ